MKFLFTAVLMITAFLQPKAQSSIAIKGGFTYSTAKADFSGVKQSTGYVPGGSFEIQVKTAFDGPLHFSPFIGYSTRGYIIKAKNDSLAETKNTIHYIDVSPQLSLDFKTGKKSSFVVSTGPLAGLAISGKEKTTLSGVAKSSKMKFSTSKDYGLFDLALHSSLGYHFDKFFVELVYQFGFASINNNEEYDHRNIRNRTFGVNIGYRIKSYK